MRAVSSSPGDIPSDIGTFAPGVHIVGGLGNALSVDLGDSVVQIDTGRSPAEAADMMQRLSALTKSPVGTLVYSHGHLGYNFGVQAWLDAAAKQHLPTPPIVAQVNAEAMIQRFRTTTPLVRLLMALEFHEPVPTTPGSLPLMSPTVTFEDEDVVTGSKRTIHIFSAPSETDGSIGAWVPDVRVLYAGPGCISALPNVGLPLRMPRDPMRWANTLDRFASFAPDTLVPQYGPVVQGAAQVLEVLTKTASALRYVHDRVLEQLNAGANLNEALQRITFPDEIFGASYLEAGYGSHHDLVRAVWSTYVGWWDRNPTSLRAAPEGEVASAVRSAIGDPWMVLNRAQALAAQGSLQLALHVVDLLALAPGEDPDIVAARHLKASFLYELAARNDDFTICTLYQSTADIIDRPPPVPTGVR